METQNDWMEHNDRNNEDVILTKNPYLIVHILKNIEREGRVPSTVYSESYVLCGTTHCNALVFFIFLSYIVFLFFFNLKSIKR